MEHSLRRNASHRPDNLMSDHERVQAFVHQLFYTVPLALCRSGA